MPLSKRITENKPKLSFGVKEEKVYQDTMPSRMPSKLPQDFKQLRQSGTVKDIVQDRSRYALPPGKRMSKTGNVYWETRKNRTDLLGSTV